MSNAKIKARLAELERQLGINQPPKRTQPRRDCPVVFTISVPSRYTGERVVEIREKDTGRVVYRADLDKNASFNFTLLGMTGVSA